MRVRNDPGQYDDLSGEWWLPDGTFAMLHWLAEARAALIGPAPREGALLVDIGCGGGLLAPRLAGGAGRGGAGDGGGGGGAELVPGPGRDRHVGVDSREKERRTHAHHEAARAPSPHRYRHTGADPQGNELRNHTDHGAASTPGPGRYRHTGAEPQEEERCTSTDHRAAPTLDPHRDRRVGVDLRAEELRVAAAHEAASVPASDPDRDRHVGVDPPAKGIRTPADHSAAPGHGPHPCQHPDVDPQENELRTPTDHGAASTPGLYRFRHIGVDLRAQGLRIASQHGVTPVRGDAMRLPFADACADVVVAGEILEHVPDWRAAIAEACRILRPGGLFVADTLADTLICRLLTFHIGERIPNGAPKGMHDPALFVPPRALAAECAKHGVHVSLRGLRPRLGPLFRWLRRAEGRTVTGSAMVPTRSVSVLYQAWGRRSG